MRPLPACSLNNLVVLTVVRLSVWASLLKGRSLPDRAGCGVQGTLRQRGPKSLERCESSALMQRYALRIESNAAPIDLRLDSTQTAGLT
jgi:hypothetical protein